MPRISKENANKKHNCKPSLPLTTLLLLLYLKNIRK